MYLTPVSLAQADVHTTLFDDSIWQTGSFADLTFIQISYYLHMCKPHSIVLELLLYETTPQLLTSILHDTP